MKKIAKALALVIFGLPFFIIWRTVCGSYRIHGH